MPAVLIQGIPHPLMIPFLYTVANTMQPEISPDRAGMPDLMKAAGRMMLPERTMGAGASLTGLSAPM